MKLCIVCQTYEQRDASSFCSSSCAKVYAITISEHLFLSNDELKQLALNRLGTYEDELPRIDSKIH